MIQIVVCELLCCTVFVPWLQQFSSPSVEFKHIAWRKVVLTVTAVNILHAVKDEHTAFYLSAADHGRMEPRHTKTHNLR